MRDMPSTGRQAGAVWLLGIAALLLAGAAAAALGGTHLHPANARAAYALVHLPWALLACGFFACGVALIFRLLAGAGRKLEEVPQLAFFFAIAAVFACFWLPVVLAGGFVQDDWMLLAGSAVRQSVLAHPLSLWHTLDTVDGNFRPLGTAFAVGWMLHLVGLHPAWFLLVNFTVSLLGCWVAYLIVRAFGLGRLTAIAAALLYLSRGITYTENAWMSALGDALAILFCGLTVLLILLARQRGTAVAVLLHVAAWVSFVLAVLSKQSALAAPAILALLLFLRPGDKQAVPLTQRLRDAVAGLAIYGGTAAVVFLHAKSLLGTHTPYPLTLNATGLSSPFSYLTWYFLPLELPNGLARFAFVTPLTGLMIALGLGWLVWRNRRALSGDRGTMLFAILAALCSLALLVPLGSRIAGYYGSMFAFWFSIALAVLLTHLVQRGPTPAGHRAALVVSVLVIAGFTEVRLKQIAFLAPGGYIWGTYGMDVERPRFQQLQALLADGREHRTVVLVDPPPSPSYYGSMLLLVKPEIDRVLIYQTKSRGGQFLANDRAGARPLDTWDALNDAGAYNWVTPLSVQQAMPLEEPVWIGFSDGMPRLVKSPIR